MMTTNPTDAVGVIDAEELLVSLRLHVDKKFINPFGEYVWLRAIKQGLTDCCLVEEPCPYHAQLTHEADGTVN